MKKSVSELEHILKVNIGQHQQRMHLLARLIFALFKVQTVHLKVLSRALGGKALLASRYRRLQRFFQPLI